MFNKLTDCQFFLVLVVPKSIYSVKKVKVPRLIAFLKLVDGPADKLVLKLIFLSQLFRFRVEVHRRRHLSEK